jgi:hypothetical protein
VSLIGSAQKQAGRTNEKRNQKNPRSSHKSGLCRRTLQLHVVKVVFFSTSWHCTCFDVSYRPFGVSPIFAAEKRRKARFLQSWRSHHAICHSYCSNSPTSQPSAVKKVSTKMAEGLTPPPAPSAANLKPSKPNKYVFPTQAYEYFGALSFFVFPCF